MNWFRAYHDICRHPKMKMVAMAAGVPKERVIAAWVCVLAYASGKIERGSVAGLTPEWVSVEIECAEEEAARILKAMVTKGLIVRDPEGVPSFVASWGDRQTTDPTAAERMRRMRERKKADETVTDPEPNGYTVTGVTDRNALRKRRTDKNREDKNTPKAPSGEGAGDKPIRKRRDRGAEPEGFATFYEAYPRKVGPAAAAKAYGKAIGKADPAVILSGLMDARAEWNRLGTATEFIPHPATWLNGGRWADTHSEAKTYKDWRYDPKLDHLPG